MKKDPCKVPVAVRNRLPKYLRVLGDLKRMKIDKISSTQFSEMLGYTASQVRQDLNHFGGFGQQGYGYKVSELYTSIRSILGLENTFNVIILGFGRIGYAFASHIANDEKEYKLVGAFDVNPQIVGQKLLGITVLSEENLEEFLAKNPVDIAVISASQDAAQKLADRVCAAGVKGILNFAAKDLDVPDGVQVENVHITDALQVLSYDLTHM